MRASTFVVHLCDSICSQLLALSTSCQSSPDIPTLCRAQNAPCIHGKDRPLLQEQTRLCLQPVECPAILFQLEAAIQHRTPHKDSRACQLMCLPRLSFARSVEPLHGRHRKLSLHKHSTTLAKFHWSLLAGYGLNLTIGCLPLCTQ